jgi:uncharacterized glyoxalase superfamily protein PhnB
MATRKKTRTKAVPKNPKKKAARKAPAPKRALASSPKALRTPGTLKSTTPSFTVDDLHKSLAFYAALGFSVGEKWTDGDVLHGAMLRAGACEVGLSQDDWKQGRDRKKGVGFRVWFDTAEDVDALAGRVKAAGFALTEEPEDHTAWGVRSFSVDDPDGFHLTFARDL